MSQGYGVDIYGLAYYGYSQPADYSVAPFTAKQSDYGDIVLSWASPNTTSWKILRLVRSTYGYPNRPEDGVVLTDIFPGTIVRTYDDPQLATGIIYYYAMFISVESPTWSVGNTYLLNQQVLYNGLYWTSTQNGNTGNTPAAGSSFWSPSQYIPTWYPAGFTASLAVANQGYTSLLYNRTPQPYKSNTSDTFSSVDIENQSLFNFESLFGWGLDLIKADYDTHLNLSNADKVSATYLDILGQQLGINTDYLSTPQQRRQRIKNAAVNYRLKGETQSIHNLIAELAGWDSAITYGPNLFDTADQTAFVHPSYDNWNANSTYFPGQLIQYNGYNYSNTTQAKGQAQAPSGTTASNTWWSAAQQYVLDTTVNVNPGTRQMSTWGFAGLSGTTGTIEGVRTGLPHPTNVNIQNWNALSIHQTNNFATGFFNIDSTAPLSTSNWSSGTNYVIRNVVLYTDGYYYVAQKPSGPGTPYGFKTPGVDQSFWKPFYFLTTDRPNIIRDGVPIAQLPVWNSTTTYPAGTNVQYNGIQYLSAQTNTNSAPSGYYYSNKNWVFISASEYTLVTSSYWARKANDAGSNTTVTPILYYYDKNGNLINNTASDYTGYNVNSEGVVARLVDDHVDLNGTTETSLANANTDGTLSSGTWLAGGSGGVIANLWVGKYGMASANQTLAGTLTYNYLTVDCGNPSGRFAMTFITDFVDTAHKTHGLVFAMLDANNFYYVTRTSLRKVASGVDTLITSWTRLQNGDRIVVDAVSDIHVYKYARTGNGALTRIALSTGTGPGDVGTVGRAGFIQKYSATGAL
jgi:hypothetical protein